MHDVDVFSPHIACSSVFLSDNLSAHLCRFRIPIPCIARSDLTLHLVLVKLFSEGNMEGIIPSKVGITKLQVSIGKEYSIKIT